jgi:hypothetical protein
MSDRRRASSSAEESTGEAVNHDDGVFETLYCVLSTSYRLGGNMPAILGIFRQRERGSNVRLMAQE